MAARGRGHFAGSGFAGRSGKAKRQTEWLSLTTNFVDFTASEFLSLGSFTQAQLAAVVPCTITRIVGMFIVAADTNFITNQIFSGAIGGMVITEAARTVAITSRPAPFTDAGDDMWFFHRYFGMVIDDRATDSDVINSINYPIDSRGQRRVEDGEAIVFSAEGGGETDGFDVALYLRMLVKLH